MVFGWSGKQGRWMSQCDVSPSPTHLSHVPPGQYRVGSLYPSNQFITFSLPFIIFKFYILVKPSLAFIFV